MNLKEFPLKQVRVNPFQTRAIDQAHVNALVQEIEKHGFHGTFVGRVDPNDAALVQLAAGAHRLEALSVLAQRADQPQTIWIDVCELTDDDMEEQAIIENAFRKELGPIDEALAMQRYFARHPQATEQQVAELFGKETQSAVSNKMSLLKHSDAMRARINAGEISEGLGRQLLPVMRIAPKEMEKIVATALAAPAGKAREEIVVNEFDAILRDKKARTLNYVPWELSWPKSELTSAPVAEIRAGEPSDLKFGACATCKDHVTTNRQDWCVGDTCYILKARLHAQMEAERISKATGIEIAPRLGATPARLVKDFADVEWARKCIASKKAKDLLRLIPLNQFVGGFEHREAEKSSEGAQTTGSNVVVLGTMDLPALKKLIPPYGSKPQAHDHTADKDADAEPRESQAALERKRLANEARARRDQSRAHAEIERLLAAATKVLCAALPVKGALLDMLAETAQFPDFSDHLAIDSAAQFQGVTKKLNDEQKRLLVMGWLLDDNARTQLRLSERTEAKTRKVIEQIALGLKIRLPKNWDSVETTPYLEGASSCWRCGCHANQFGVNSDLSQADMERGWAVTDNGEVYCPECAPIVAEEIELGSMGDANAHANVKKNRSRKPGNAKTVKRK